MPCTHIFHFFLNINDTARLEQKDAILKETRFHNFAPKLT